VNIPKDILKKGQQTNWIVLRVLVSQPSLVATFHWCGGADKTWLRWQCWIVKRSVNVFVFLSFFRFLLMVLCSRCSDLCDRVNRF